MSITDITPRAAKARTLAQITLDRSNADSPGALLYESRRIARVLSPIASELRFGINPISPANVRRETGKIVILVRTSAQMARLRQFLPRMQELISQAGYRDTLTLRIHPQTTEIELRSHERLQLQHISSEVAEALGKKAEELTPSALKDAFAALLQTLKKSAT